MLLPFETVLFEKDGPVGYVTLNRPRVINAVNVQMRDDLYQAMSAARDDPDISVIILKGAERGFCSGADVSEFGTAPSPIIARQVRWERDQWGLILGIPKPIIVAIHGYAIGAGIEMSLCCDLRIASEETRFGLPEVALGMIPAAGGSQTVPRHLRLGHSMEVLLRGDLIGAEDALRMGLVQRVVSREALLPTAEAWAHRLASFDQRAVRAAKEAVYRGLDLPLPQALGLEQALVARLRAGAQIWK